MSYLGDLSQKSCPFRALAAEDRDLAPRLLSLAKPWSRSTPRRSRSSRGALFNLKT